MLNLFGLDFKPYIFENKDNLKGYIYENEQEVIYAVKEQIGKVHPFLENVSATSYYEIEGEGYYFMGYHKMYKMYFLPVMTN